MLPAFADFSPNLAVLDGSFVLMGWLDTVVRGICHEINGIVAMQHLKLSFVQKGTKAALIRGLLALANPAFAGTIAHPAPPDPLLDGGPTTACASRTDYAGGVDVNGRPVVPADVAAGPVPVPGQIAVPLHGGAVNPATGAGNGPYVSLDGKKLDPLINPPPCH